MTGGNGTNPGPATPDVQRVGPNIMIALDPLSHRLTVNSNISDEIILFGMLEQAKAIILETARERHDQQRSRIAVPPPGLKV